MYIPYVVIAVIVLIFLFNFFHILREYERAVIFTLGRFWKVKGPGLIMVVPLIQQMVRVQLRTIVMDIPPQDVISRDNVSVRVNAVVYFRVIDPERAVIQIEDYFAAVNQLAQTTLRSVLGQHELDEMLAERTKLNADIQKILDEHTDAWGIKIGMVEIKQIDLNDNMVRAIAQQAEAERGRRAKVIHADGELQASQKLAEAARVLATQPQSMQLRYLQTLSNISEEKNSTIIFPIPIDLFSSFMKK
jgi:regulator of protease activity HflC (stomatin/prohibitin superfamily)